MPAFLRRAPSTLAGLALSASLAGCGGGGNESGPPDSIQLSADEVTVTSSTAECVIGKGPTVFIFGGQPPYKIYNPLPRGMTFDTSTVGDSGQGFTITFNGVCMEGIAVSIEDDMGRLASLSVTSTPNPDATSGE